VIIPGRPPVMDQTVADALRINAPAAGKAAMLRALLVAALCVLVVMPSFDRLPRTECVVVMGRKLCTDAVKTGP
jgi:hypothetical protein